MANSNPTLNSFMPISKLGEGTFSSVYKVKRISDGGIYALKKIKIACLKQKQKANALNQIRILASITSSYIITYKQAFFDEKLNLLCIVMEQANEGDLLNRINEHKQKKKLFSEAEIWKAAYHILSGLRVLHSNSILHRDLKSANIFICNGVYKLGDLNVSKVNDHEQRLVKTQTGTPFYASPEIWRDQPYGSQSDIWSFGCILYEMCCLKPPFNGKDLNDLYKSVQRGEYQPIPKIYSRELDQIIRMCLRQRAKERPSAQELLKEDSIVMSKCDYYEIVVEKEHKSKDKLLSTIKVPTDLKKLNSQLPQSKYRRGEDNQQAKTALKISPSKIAQSDNILKLLKSNKKTQDSKLTNQTEQINRSKEYQTPLPLPQRIKNHLNNINRSDKLISRKNYNLKPKIHSSIAEQRQQITIKKSVEYLSPIKQNVNKKKRPFSCNYLQMRQPQRVANTPYYISNLRPQSGGPAPVYNSDRKAVIGGLREKNEMFSDRKILMGNGRDPYLLEKLEKIERDKIRCRSANFKSKGSGYSELKERLQARYKNLKPIYQSQKVGSKVIKSEASEHINYSKDLSNNYNNNYSYVIPTSLSAQIYPNKNNPNNYLMEIQSKLLQGENKQNRYDLLGRNKVGSNQSQIRRLVKGHHLYGKIHKL